MFCRWLCIVSRPQPGGQDKARWRGGTQVAIRDFLCSDISPDLADGIGGWSEADFVTAMGKGTSPSGEHYYPAFPYTSYQRMKQEDVRDLLAYLKTLPAVQGKARDHDLPIHSVSPHSRCVEISVPRRPRVRARSGEVAAVESRPTSSTAPAIARSATARAMASVGSLQAGASLAVQTRKAAAAKFPTSPKPG